MLTVFLLQEAGEHIIGGIIALAIILAGMIVANLITHEQTEEQRNSKLTIAVYDNLVSANKRVKHCKNLLLRIKGNEASSQMMRLNHLQERIETEIAQMENDIDLELERINSNLKSFR